MKNKDFDGLGAMAKKHAHAIMGALTQGESSMKRRPFALTLAFSLLCLASCSSGNQSNPSSSSSKGNPEDLLISRVRKLADNVDQLPTANAVFGSSQKKGLAPKQAGVIDETQPSAAVLNTPALFAYGKDLWDSIDGTIEIAIQTKDAMVAQIFVLDTWVMAYGSPNGNDCYKLSYDADRDAAVMEHFYISSTTRSGVEGKDYQYVYLSSSYDLTGEMLIDYARFGFFMPNNGTLRLYDKTAISFRENSYWNCTKWATNDWNPNERTDYQYVIHADLSKSDREITQLQKTTNYTDGVVFDAMVTADVQGKSENLIYVLGAQDEITCSCHVYTPEGYNYLYSVSSSNMQYFYLPLYRFNGYDKIENHYETDRSNGKRYVYIGEEVYQGGERYEYEGCDWEVIGLASGVASEPALLLLVPEEVSGGAQASDLIHGFIESLGLAPNDEFLDEAIRVSADIDELCAEREALGKVGFRYNSAEEFDLMYDRYDIIDVTQGQILSFESVEKCPYDQQLEESAEYHPINVNPEGKFSFDEQRKVLAIEATQIEVPVSPFLSKNADYKGVLALRSGHLITPLRTSETAKFNGKDALSITVPSLDLPVESIPMLSDDSYELVVYLASAQMAEEEVRLSRVSAIAPLPYEGEPIDCVLKEEVLEDSDSILTERFEIAREGNRAFLKHHCVIESETPEEEQADPS